MSLLTLSSELENWLLVECISLPLKQKQKMLLPILIQFSRPKSGTRGLHLRSSRVPSKPNSLTMVSDNE